MSGPNLSRMLADLLLVAHGLYVLFVIGGMVLTLAGRALRWEWVRNPWFRTAHLAAIGLVMVQGWMGRRCPLTDWEMALRERAGQTFYDETFMTHWVGRYIYYDFPQWVFTLGYTVFAGLVALGWLLVPPRPFRGVRRDTL